MTSNRDIRRGRKCEKELNRLKNKKKMDKKGLLIKGFHAGDLRLSCIDEDKSGISIYD